MNVKSLCLAGLAAALLGLGQARAQYTLPTQRPVVSPYLNLLRTGSSPAINLYGIVRPEIAFGNAINQLDQQQQGLAGQQQDLASYTALPPTGQGTGGARFLTQSKYYMTNGGRGGVGGGGQLGGGRAGGGGQMPGGGGGIGKR